MDRGDLDVSIAIDGSEVATGELSGGHTSDSKNTDWAHEFDSFSMSTGEGVNITLNGGIYIDNLAVVGNTWAKVSKYTSEHGNNGKRPVDPFYCCASNFSGEKG